MKGCRSHTRASLKESKGYPPPEKFWIEIPPLQEGYSLAKYSPPLENFRPILPPELEDSPLKLVKFWDSPLREGDSLGSPLNPSNPLKITPPLRVRCLPTYGWLDKLIMTKWNIIQWVFFYFWWVFNCKILTIQLQIWFSSWRSLDHSWRCHACLNLTADWWIEMIWILGWCRM